MEKESSYLFVVKQNWSFVLPLLAVFEMRDKDWEEYFMWCGQALERVPFLKFTSFILIGDTIILLSEGKAEAESHWVDQ